MALEALLYKQGFQVRASDIRQNAAAYRVLGRDGIAWEVYGSVVANGDKATLHSWDTMEECVSNGLSVFKVSGTSGLYEVSANDQPSRT